jgi:hypothetical protein
LDFAGKWLPHLAIRVALQTVGLKRQKKADMSAEQIRRHIYASASASPRSLAHHLFTQPKHLSRVDGGC